MTNDNDPVHPFVEIGHVVPALIEAPAAASVAAHVSAFLDVMGITDGCAHTEVRLTPSGPQVIGTHTRVGGDSIPTLVRQATGHDLLDLAVDWAVERKRSPDKASGITGTSAVRFFTPPAGTVVRVSGVQRWQGQPGVVALHLPLRAGDTIAPISDSQARAGYVVATSSTPAQALDLCRQVIDGVQIVVR